MKSLNDESDELVLEVNEKQGEFLDAIMTRHYMIAAMIGGRGAGKSITLADVVAYASDELPRAKGGWGVKTIAKAKSKLTPSLKSGLRRWKIHEYNWETGQGTYVLWREPPPHFERPYESPDNWGNCISFPNGFVLELEGFKMASEENRGSNFDFYLIDEGLNFKHEWLKVVLPTLRANVGKFDSPLHHTLFVFSSPPWTPDAQWLWKIEEDARKEPDKYFFCKVMTKDNLQFLPPGYIDLLRKTLLKIEFEVEVEGKKMSRHEKTFYPAFDREKHVVDDDDDGVEDDLVMWEGKPFLRTNEPFVWSLDFNAHFTSGTLWQEAPGLGRCVDDLFVREADKGLTMAQTLAVQFCRKYAGHRTKKIILTGDRNGKNKSAGSDKNMFEQVEEVLVDGILVDGVRVGGGWTVDAQPLSYNPPHKDKHVMVNDVMGERHEHLFMLRFDALNAKSTIVSIEASPILVNYEKDKSSERSGFDQEKATHLSDTVDYYVIWRLRGGAAAFGDFEVGFI